MVWEFLDVSCMVPQKPLSTVPKYHIAPSQVLQRFEQKLKRLEAKGILVQMAKTSQITLRQHDLYSEKMSIYF